MLSTLQVELDITDLRVAVMSKLTEIVEHKNHDLLALGINKSTDGVVAGFVISEKLIREAGIEMARKKLGRDNTNGSVKAEFVFDNSADKIVVAGMTCSFKYEVKSNG